jgi:hypothetical protein
LSNFPGNHQTEGNGKPNTRRRAAEQQPQRTGYRRIQLRQRHADVNRPSIRTGEHAVNSFDIDTLAGLGSRRVRASARHGFLYGRCRRSCFCRFDVRRARNDFFLGVDDGAGPSFRQSRLAEDRADLVG